MEKTLSQAHSYFEDVLRKQRKKNRIPMVLLFLFFGVGTVLWFPLDATEYPSARLGTLGLLCLPVVPFYLWYLRRENQGLLGLREPSHIVWFYGIQKGGKVNAVMVGFDNGKLYRMNLPLISFKEGFSQEGLQHLRACAPHAAEGYSEERRQAFNKEPGSLRA
jgi:hypothetical protein